MLKLFFTTFLSLPFVLLSQIKGVILDEKNQEPIAGAKIILSTGQKVQTNVNGEFVIAPSRYPVKLNFGMLGYVDDSLVITRDTVFTKYLQIESIQIKTIVISAGRRSQEIEEVPISMEIIKPELINNKGLTNLEQAVDQTPGVYAMDGQVSIRGGGGYAYGAGSRVMLLWNGVPMLSPDIGDAKWNAIPMEQASQIEVLKGASSVLYGSGALNGIISLTEKEPTPQGKFTFKVQSGIYDNPRRSSLRWWNKNPTFHLVDVYGGKSFKRIGASIGANMYLDSGYRQGESEKRFRINGSLYFRPQKLTKIRAGLGYNFQYQDVNMFILWKSDTNCYQPMDGTLNRQKAIRFNVDPYFKYIDKKNNKHYLRTRYYLVTTGNNQDYKDASFAQLFYADYQFQKKLYAGINLTAGASANIGSVKSWVFQDHISQNYAAYTQLESKFKNLDLTAGMRLEYYQLDTMEMDSRYEYLDSLYIPVYPVFRMGAHYAINKMSHLRMSLGQGVRFPSIAERYVSTSVGGLVIFRNPNLKPEKGWSGEIGYKQIVGIGKEWKGYIDVAAFVNEYSNMTEFTFGYYNPFTGESLISNGVLDTEAYNELIAQGLTLNNLVGFRATNAERARISGIEFSFNSQGKIGPVEVTSLLGYTYMNPISLNNDPSYKGTFSDTSTNILKYRFRHMAKADIQLGYKNFEIGFSNRYNSWMMNIDRVFEESIGTQQILPGLKEYREKNKKGAFVIDLRIAYSFLKHYRFNFIVNNLLNAEYASRPGDIQPPRSFLVQFQCNF
jgi:outer membrane receptor protein involved in Fe transport